MIKNKSIRDFVRLINITFGEKSFVVNDYWQSDSCAIGLQKDNKLIYVANYGKDKYFYELEIVQELKSDDDLPYIVQGSENNVSSQKILEIMSKFFNIQKK